MAVQSVSYCTLYDLATRRGNTIVTWLSCNGEGWGMGPTAVFASAAALFLYSELQATINSGGAPAHPTLLENMLISTMVLGMLALMVHLWVCFTRFFLCYLDTLIRDSPGVLLEMTTVGLLGGESELVPLGPLTRFLRQQQGQIHITACWFLALCYADFIRKHYCERFTVPYIEQWKNELHVFTARGVDRTIMNLQTFVAKVQQRLGRHESEPPPNSYAQTDSTLYTRRASSVDLRAYAAQLAHPCPVGGQRTSDSALYVKKHDGPLPPLPFPIQTSDTTGEAIEKLKHFINATRCYCNTDKPCEYPRVEEATSTNVLWR
ncbi:PREDICTED: uncharacterized protein LOC106115536 [Papilio xuthus]|uniref:Uncharacterized protein LOC106115536 n=1 Tax=Papilio xuthus TaxID=66420 RepID=A0AAJ6Z2Y8_PAPXU|nr:PREDICTED: uncharacterized protein LOC106115536 [Papilio xuthus]